MLSNFDPCRERGILFLSEVAPIAEKKAKSFDVLASVDLIRYDLDNHDQILPETWERVYDEELTYIAEGINQRLFTEFRLKRVDDELVYFHNGQWRPYLSSLVNAVSVYQLESIDDPRKKFMLDRAVDDLRIGYQLADLSPSQKLRWNSNFPDNELTLFGSRFIGSLGFQVERRMGFLYEAETDDEGYLTLKSYSVDNSDDDAFNAAMESEDMVEGYDSKMSQKHGGSFMAGRRPGENLSEENAWDTVRAHKDLIEDFFMKEIERLALSDLPREQLEKAKKRLTYGVWGALRKRLEEGAVISDGFLEQSGGYSLVGNEVRSAYQEMSSRGEVLFGCGGSITGEEAILHASPNEVFDSIFGGNKKWFGCYYCGAKQYGDPCASHLYCPSCTAEIKDGAVISTGNGRNIRKGFFDVLADEFRQEWRKWNNDYSLEQEKKRAKKAA